MAWTLRRVTGGNESVIRSHALLLCVITNACSGEAFSTEHDSGSGAGTPGTGGVSALGGASSGGRSSGGASGGAKTSGGLTGAGGSGGTGGANPVLCPPEEPVAGSPCEIEELSCKYGTCCVVQAVCLEGKWLTGQSTCGASECPDTLPMSTGACECEPGLQCLYDQCAAAGHQIVTRCDNSGTWTSSTTGCAVTTFSCGPSLCLEGQVCVSTVAPGPIVTYGCSIDNPCDAEAVQCSCAESLCDGKLCTDSPGPNIICGVP